MISHGFAYFLGLIADIAVANPRRAPQRVFVLDHCLIHYLTISTVPIQVIDNFFGVNLHRTL